MAISYIDSTEKTVVGTTQVSSLAFDVPTHQEGDFLVAFLVISEYEFCIQAQTEAQAGETYEFRLVDGAQSGEKLEEYDVTAKVTIAP